MLVSMILLISGLPLGVFSKIMIGPKNTIAKAGGTVMFPCVTGSKDCTSIDWAKQENIQSSVAIYKSGIGMLNNNTYPWSRYNVSPVDGCNLTIRDLKLNDSGLYSCSENQDRHFVLVVVEPEEKCQTNAMTNISIGTVYNTICKAKFNPNLIKPWKIELHWSNVSLSPSVNITEADAVVLAYTGKAEPPVVPEFNCTGSLYVEQALQESHDTSLPSFQACTLPSLKVRHPVTKITCFNIYGTEKVEFGKSDTVKCDADGYPLPTCQCKSDTTGKNEDCSQFVIPETSSPEDTYTYTCTATNTFSPGKPSTVTVTLTVTAEEPSRPVGLIVGIVIGVLFGLALIVVLVVILYRKFFKPGESEKKSEAVLPLKEKESAPPKPPRASTNSNQGDK